MNELNEKKICLLYNSISSLNENEILSIIEQDYEQDPSLSHWKNTRFFNLNPFTTQEYNPENIIENCKQVFDSMSNEVKVLLEKNPKNTKVILEIIQLVAPVIAQQHSGIGGLAIVGALTIICRQQLDL